MTDDVNTNTFQGQDGTDGTSSCPTGRCRSIHLPPFLKRGKLKKMGIFTKRELDEKAIPLDYLPCPSSQFLVKRTL